jgi:hypothetical protein
MTDEQVFCVTITADQLDAARRVLDRGMANGEIPETPDLHAFSRWAIREATAIRQRARADRAEEALRKAHGWLAEIAVLGPIHDTQPEKAMRLAAMRGRDEAQDALNA